MTDQSQAIYAHMDICHRIVTAEHRIMELEDQLRSHLETADDDDFNTAPELMAKLEAQERHLESLRKVERILKRGSREAFGYFEWEGESCD